jgi:uncharacterized coiled-coil protein SlyX
MNNHYYTHYNGQYTDVLPLEDCFRAIECRIADKNIRIEHLEQQVKELQNEHYKDEKIASLTEELKKVKEELSSGFGISKEDSKKIQEWKKNHDTTVHNNPKQFHGASGGGYTYRFYPTGIGTVASCICGACHRKAFIEAKGDLEVYHNLMKSFDGAFGFSEF